jgi:AraC family transcriptional activator FtrA
MASHRVVALVSAPQGSFELGCAAAVFSGEHYQFSLCAERPGPLTTTSRKQTSRSKPSPTG